MSLNWIQLSSNSLNLSARNFCTKLNLRDRKLHSNFSLYTQCQNYSRRFASSKMQNIKMVKKRHHLWFWTSNEHIEMSNKVKLFSTFRWPSNLYVFTVAHTTPHAMLIIFKFIKIWFSTRLPTQHRINDVSCAKSLPILFGDDGGVWSRCKSNYLSLM